MGHQQRFEVDGVVYTSLDDVPQPHRDTIAAMLADRDGNGTPDIFDDGSGVQHVVHHTETIEVDGVRYASVDDVPEPQRSMVRDALDRATPSSGPANPAPPPLPSATSRTSMSAPAPSPIVRSAGWANRTKLLAAFVAVDVVAVAIVLWLALR